MIALEVMPELTLSTSAIDQRMKILMELAHNEFLPRPSTSTVNFVNGPFRVFVHADGEPKWTLYKFEQYRASGRTAWELQSILG